uniref:Terminase small subunit n=1 Tax=Rhodopseudomonas palustris (strain DX-1) TaxID=652103 RepID=E6VFL7_RHOPX
MPILDNARHEKYAQELAKGASQSDAYVAAGYARNDSHASRLARNGKVAARVAELQAAGADEAELTIAAVLEELKRIAFAPMPDEFVRACDKRAALVDIGNHLGMFKSKVELTGKDGASLVPIVTINGAPSGAG